VSELTSKVNLPAHLVIIKNTQTYINNKMSELSDMDILQMIGRAGRPQFDDTGVAVILTRSDKRMRYENLVAGKTPLESRLHLQLIEHINAEIGLRTIIDIETAKKWLRSTFLYVRCRVNPEFYDLEIHPNAVEKMVEEICVRNIERLQRATLIQTCDGILRLTAIGEAAAKYCIRFNTMEMIVANKDPAKLRQVVNGTFRRSLMRSLKYYAKPRSFPVFASGRARKDSIVPL
jgi:ATP-dependent DNA helicase HFM1/MER3